MKKVKKISKKKITSIFPIFYDKIKKEEEN